MLTAAADGRRVTVSAALLAAKWLVPRLGRFETAHPRSTSGFRPAWSWSISASGEVRHRHPLRRRALPGAGGDPLMAETVLPVASPGCCRTAPGDPAGPGPHILLHDGSPDADDSCRTGRCG